MGLNLDLRAGTSRAWNLQVENPDGSIPTGVFLDSDVLAAKLWAGSTLAPIVTKAPPAIAWIDSANAQFVIDWYPADTAGLAAGIYYVAAQATRGTDVADLLPRGSTITITVGPGTDAARRSYITAVDLRKLAPWLDDIQGPAAETGFADQCADASDWLDENILRNYPGGYVSLLGEHGTALASWAGTGATLSSLRNPWILQLLAGGPAVANTAGGLIVTTRTRQVLANYALHLVAEGMLTRGPYAALSARYLARANQLLVGYTAELSTNGAVDQWGALLAQIPINFGTARTLRV